MTPPPVRAYAPARSSKPHPWAPPPDPRLKSGPVFVASGGVMNFGAIQVTTAPAFLAQARPGPRPPARCKEGSDAARRSADMRGVGHRQVRKLPAEPKGQLHLGVTQGCSHIPADVQRTIEGRGHWDWQELSEHHDEGKRVQEDAVRDYCVDGAACAERWGPGIAARPAVGGAASQSGAEVERRESPGAEASKGARPKEEERHHVTKQVVARMVAERSRHLGQPSWTEIATKKNRLAALPPSPQHCYTPQRTRVCGRDSTISRHTVKLSCMKRRSLQVPLLSTQLQAPKT